MQTDRIAMKAAAKTGLRSTGQAAQRFQSLFGLVAILVLSALLSPVRDGRPIFLAPDNLLNIVRFASENGVIAVGMTLVILTGGIDLSVGAVLALCAVGAAACLMRYHLNVEVTIVLMLALGALVGAINGAVTTRFKVQSFITTLAMMSTARGVASLWAGGYAIPLAFGADTGDASPLFKSLFAGQLTVFGLEIPAQLFYFVGAGVLATFVLNRTVFGRHVYAVGGNAVAARLSGVAVTHVQITVFAVSGFLAALAALLHAALVEQGSHIDGSGYELNAIAAVVIGGTSLSGGVGTVVGSMIGALILSILDNILGLRNIQSEYQAILKGIIIVLAVILQRKK
ncbi:MAG: ABC transporter permease [Janthinobacterium lividum]